MWNVLLEFIEQQYAIAYIYLFRLSFGVIIFAVAEADIAYVRIKCQQYQVAQCQQYQAEDANNIISRDWLC